MKRLVLQYLKRGVGVFLKSHILALVAWAFYKRSAGQIQIKLRSTQSKAKQNQIRT